MKKSAGILLYKFENKELQIFLVHPGGPFWKNKNLGSWSIPKGEFTDEEPLKAARREFEEETGISIQGDFMELNPVKLKSGKLIYAWALQHDIDPSKIHSNTFELEWPPKSGKFQNVPEIDRAEWFPVEKALQKINSAQGDLIIQLVARLELSE